MTKKKLAKYIYFAYRKNMISIDQANRWLAILKDDPYSVSEFISTIFMKECNCLIL